MCWISIIVRALRARVAIHTEIDDAFYIGNKGKQNYFSSCRRMSITHSTELMDDVLSMKNVHIDNIIFRIRCLAFNLRM